MLREDLEKFESYVEDAVEVEIDDNQFSALVCFCFNVGPGTEGFGGSTLLKLLNNGDYQGAANQFPVWNKVNGEPWPGLTRRRLAEPALFLGMPEVRVLTLTEQIMQGEDVRQVQEAPIAAGINVSADGVFGKDTDRAVRQFQQQKGLTADGVVGVQTRK